MNASGELGVYEAIEKVTTRALNEEKNEFEERDFNWKKRNEIFDPIHQSNTKELHKKCNDKGPKMADRTKYSVWPEGGTKISVERYEDFANLDFRLSINMVGLDQMMTGIRISV